MLVYRHLVAKGSDIIVVNLNGEFICKIINIKHRLLLSANSDFKSISISEADQFSIEGVVIRSIRCYRIIQLLETNI